MFNLPIDATASCDAPERDARLPAFWPTSEIQFRRLSEILIAL